jgi:hypothetical protein
MGLDKALISCTVPRTPRSRRDGGGLAAMRNSLNDSHGRGKASVRPAPRHAKLAINAGFAVAGFLIDTHVEGPTRSAT